MKTNRSILRTAICTALLAACQAGTLLAELPLPDVLYYGKIATAGGIPVISGIIRAKVQRGAATVIEPAGQFKAGDGSVWYVLRIPMETAIGAPGPSGAAAREGDRLGSLLLDGTALELQSQPAVFKAGSVTRIDAISTVAPGSRYIRGDCDGSLERDVSDAIRMLTFMFISPEQPPCLDACDSDGSRSMDITDPIHLLTYLFLTGTEPPQPGAGAICGPDPNAPALGCIQSSCPAGG